jgi:prohibitin 1
MRFLFSVFICLSLIACATVPSGQAGVVLRMGSVDNKVLTEGVHVLSPLDEVETYDLRAQEHSEDLAALSADGAPLEAHSSIITFHPAREEVVALARETGPNYYQILVKPLLRSSLRKVLAGFRADQLDTPGIDRAEKQVTADIAERLRPHHVIFDSITLRTLRIDPQSKAYHEVLETSVQEQEAIAARELPVLARQHAEERRAEARGVAASQALIVPSLSPQVLADAAQRAWTQLLTAPTAHVLVRPPEQPIVLEVAP